MHILVSLLVLKLPLLSNQPLPDAFLPYSALPCLLHHIVRIYPSQLSRTRLPVPASTGRVDDAIYIPFLSKGNIVVEWKKCGDRYVTMRDSNICLF